ncbi:hypothetical protein [Christiangramia salexigens]|nr:hypothetical protein [Christiangramia salexigens]
MTTFSKINQEFGAAKAGNQTHREAFLSNRTGTGRMCWYNRRRYA